MQVTMQRMRLVSSVAVALAVVVIGGTALAQSVGTWKLNLAKSKYTEGQAPKSLPSYMSRQVQASRSRWT